MPSYIARDEAWEFAGFFVALIAVIVAIIIYLKQRQVKEVTMDRAAQPVCRHEPTLTLDAREDNSLDEVTLGEVEDDDAGQDGHEGGGHQHVQSKTPTSKR